MSTASHLLSTISPRRVSLLYLLVFEVILFSVWIPDLFLSTVTLRSVTSSQAVVGILALAALIVFLSGEFDLTIGANMALAVVIVCQQTQDHPDRGFFVICLVAVLACTLVGLANGLIVGRLKVNSFIATLAMSQVLAALALIISDNAQVSGVLPARFVEVGRDTTFSLPNAVYATLALAFVTWYVVGFTALGRRLLATGLNREAARLSGIRTEAFVVGSFVLSGLVAGLAGLVYVAQVGTFSNTIGPPLLFPAFAAIFLGATQFNFRPNVWGTLLAIFTLALGVQGFQLATTSGEYWISSMFNGVALLAAVIFSKRQHSARRSRATGRGSAETREGDDEVDSAAVPAKADASRGSGSGS